MLLDLVSNITMQLKKTHKNNQTEIVQHRASFVGKWRNQLNVRVTGAMVHMTKREVVKYFMVSMKTDSGLLEAKLLFLILAVVFCMENYSNYLRHSRDH